MWVIIIKSILALVSIFTGRTIFYKYIKDNKVLVFLAGSVSILSAVYLFSEVRRDIDKLVVEKKVEVKVKEKQEKAVEIKKTEPKHITTSKWFSPTDERVTWNKAKELCEDNGGRLPTIGELKEIIRDCGGINTTPADKNWDSATDKNLANKAYQACYKRKGFSSYFYWSSATYEGGHEDAWYVYFYSGNVYSSYKDNGKYVRCVRAGQ